MKCDNCENMIPDNSIACPFCGVYNPAKPQSGSYEIIIEEKISFFLDFSGKSRLTIGRKDRHLRIDIDLGPFDKHPAVSREHGFFLEKDSKLYYTDTSKNGTLINEKKISHSTIQINDGDKLSFAGVQAEIRQITQ